MEQPPFYIIQMVLEKVDNALFVTVRTSPFGDWPAFESQHFAAMMDGMLGADYEDGLSRLKQVLESAPVE